MEINPEEKCDELDSSARLKLESLLVQLAVDGGRLKDVRVSGMADSMDLSASVPLWVTDTSGGNWFLTFVHADVVPELIGETETGDYFAGPGGHLILVRDCSPEMIMSAVERFLSLHLPDSQNG